MGDFTRPLAPRTAPTSPPMPRQAAGKCATLALEGGVDGRHAVPHLRGDEAEELASPRSKGPGLCGLEGPLTTAISSGITSFG